MCARGESTRTNGHDGGGKAGSEVKCSCGPKLSVHGMQEIRSRRSLEGGFLKNLAVFEVFSGW